VVHVSKELHEVALLTVVTESLVENRLLEDLSACGVAGWTITPARGVGPANRRLSEIEGGNSKIEVLASREVVEKVWEVLTSKYFPNYAVTAWQSQVLVSRFDRYS